MLRADFRNGKIELPTELEEFLICVWKRHYQETQLQDDELTKVKRIFEYYTSHSAYIGREITLSDSLLAYMSLDITQFDVDTASFPAELIGYPKIFAGWFLFYRDTRVKDLQDNGVKRSIAVAYGWMLQEFSFSKVQAFKQLLVFITMRAWSRSISGKLPEPITSSVAWFLGENATRSERFHYFEIEDQISQIMEGKQPPFSDLVSRLNVFQWHMNNKGTARILVEELDLDVELVLSVDALAQLHRVPSINPTVAENDVLEVKCTAEPLFAFFDSFVGERPIMSEILSKLICTQFEYEGLKSNALAAIVAAKKGPLTKQNLIVALTSIMEIAKRHHLVELEILTKILCEELPVRVNIIVEGLRLNNVLAVLPVCALEEVSGDSGFTIEFSPSVLKAALADGCLSINDFGPADVEFLNDIDALPDTHLANALEAIKSNLGSKSGSTLKVLNGAYLVGMRVFLE